MNVVQLVRAGTVDPALLHGLRDAIPNCLPVRCEILSVELDLAPAYHPERQQYHSSEILQQLHFLVRPQDWRLLSIADVDLYIPILQYVFGEAQLGGRCALVSCARLRQEFYGLDPDEEILTVRLLKESVHELGHTFGLRHCQDYRCAMASAHAVEWIDLREPFLCRTCRAQLDQDLRPDRIEENRLFF